MELTAAAVMALVTLTALEIVLGIDNIVFIAILCGKLPPHQRDKARRIGLFLAMFMRIGLLLSITWVMSLTAPLFHVPDPFGWFSHAQAATQAGAHGAATAGGAAAHASDPLGVSGRDLILLFGGLFLIGKATYEIHDKLEGEEPHGATPKFSGFAGVIFQILLLDLVFSLDSVITAVGMAQQLWVMVTAVVVAVGVMLAFSGYIVRFIEKHPTMKLLALSFLVLIGVMLVVEAFDVHVPKGYIYFAMAFSLIVEIINIRFRKVSKPVHLQQSYVDTKASE